MTYNMLGGKLNLAKSTSMPSCCSSVNFYSFNYYDVIVFIINHRRSQGVQWVYVHPRVRKKI